MAGTEKLTESATAKPAGTSAQAELDAIREKIASLSEQAQSVAGQAAKVTAETAREGTADMRSAIRRNPAISMAIAATAGASLGLLLTSRSSSRTYDQQLRSFVGGLDNYSINNLTSSIERAINRATPRKSLSEVGRQIVDSARDTNVQDGLSSTAETLMKWWDRAKHRAAAKADKLLS